MTHKPDTQKKPRLPKWWPQVQKRLIQVLLTTCESNCQSYDWGTRALSFIRARDFPGLYEWADSSGTVVCQSADEQFALNQMCALVVKYPFPEGVLPLDPKKRAREKFAESERRNAVTNKRFRADRWLRSTRFRQYIVDARELVRKVLGDEPNLTRISSKCSLSTGASIGVHGNATNFYRKLYADSWTVTPSALPYALTFLSANEQLAMRFQTNKQYGPEFAVTCVNRDEAIEGMRDRCRMVTHNKVSFVPKNAKTHRVIAIEPLLNSFCQKGVEQELLALMRPFGINLSDQSRNRRLAREGSVTGLLATMDLSSASDLIALMLGKVLLPPSWFRLCDDLRSPEYELDGAKHRAEKFFSMGNGFCFPLETLMFWALTRAVVKRAGLSPSDVSVYGDDIIVPAHCASEVRDLFSFCGFKVNVDKTFTSGPFRESCGADWYKGLDIRPVYLDRHLRGKTDAMIFHNAGYRSDRCEVFFAEVRPVIRKLFDPNRVWERPRLETRPCGPTGATELELRNLNGAFTVDHDVFMSSKGARWSQRYQRWQWREQLFQPVADLPPPGKESDFLEAQYLSCLRNPGSSLNLRMTTKLTVRYV